MNVEVIGVSRKAQLFTNDCVSQIKKTNYLKQNQSDLFVKQNDQLTFGKTSGVGGAAGFGVGTIVGLVAASVITGGVASLPLLTALGYCVAGSATVAAGMAGGAFIGDKVEKMVKK